MSSSVSSSPPRGGAHHKKKQQQQQASPAASASASASVQSFPRSKKQPPKNENNLSIGQASVASAASAPVRVMHSSASSFSSPFRAQQQQQQQQQPQQAQPQPPQAQPQPLPQSSSLSFPDQLTGILMQGSLEFLKLAGGLGGQVVAPPLFHVVLPRLWNEMRIFISQNTPRRGKDWFAILSSSLSHLIQIIRKTIKGQEFVHRLQIWWFSVVTCISSPSSRQVIIDVTAWNVFFYKLLSTPEFNACMRQSVITTCRLIDTMYLHKQVLHDTMALVSSWIAVCNDSTSTAALAEVTARLCLALEMEQAAQQQQQQTRRNANKQTKSAATATGTAATTSQQQQQRRQGQGRRRERNAYQTAVYQKPILMTQPEAAVEDVILSSLGCASSCTTTTKTSSSSRSNKVRSIGGDHDNRSGVKKNKRNDWTNLDDDEDDDEDNNNMYRTHHHENPSSAANDDDNMSLLSSTTASPLPCTTDKDNDDDDDKERKNEQEEEDLHAKPVNVDYLRQHIISNQQQQPSGGTPAAAAVPAIATTTRASSTTTTTKTNHTENKQAAAAVAYIDHGGDDDRDDEDMEDLILVEALVLPTYDHDTKTPLPPTKRNRTLVKASGSNNNIDSPLLEDVDNNENCDDHAVQQQSTTATTPIPVQQQQRPQQLDGESSLSYFYRILDQVLEDERKNGVEHLWATTTNASAAGKMQQQRGRVRRRPLPSRRRTNNDGDWPPDSTSTATTTVRMSVWEQFKRSMAEAAAHEQQDKDLQPLQKTPAGTSRSKIMIVGLLAISAALFLMTFSAFGCYGVYTFFFASHQKLLQSRQPSQDEVVIRIIRQVVHVDAATGHVLKKIDDSSKGKDLSLLSLSKSSSFSLLQEQPHVMDKISECVANVMDD